VYICINVCLNSDLHVRKSKKIAYIIEVKASNKKDPNEKKNTLF
jgi:hypothetical protein